jgi:hypothetical protein
VDRCEENVSIACGPCLLAQEEERKNRKYLIHKDFLAREEEEEFYTLDV